MIFINYVLLFMFKCYVKRKKNLKMHFDLKKKVFSKIHKHVSLVCVDTLCITKWS